MKTYQLPLACWLTSLAGLVLALVMDGAGDLVALLLLCVPLIAISAPALRALVRER